MDRRTDAQTVYRALFCAFTLAFLIAGVLAPDLPEMIPGFVRLCTVPAQLTRDYFAPHLGSVSGAMLNCFFVGAACTALTFLPGAVVTGGTVLGYFLTVCFGTFGINIMNILPLMFGVFVYARIHREPFAKHINMAMFATGVSPIITHVLFFYPVLGGEPGPTPASVALALFIGVAFGCALPPVCAHSMNFHKGYDLFNAGPAVGFLCFVIFAVLHRTVGVDTPAIGADLGDGQPLFVNAFCLTTFGLIAACGLWLNGGFKGYGGMFMDPGFRTDFTAKYPPGLNLLNIGLHGLLMVGWYNLIGAKFTGPTMGVIIAMLCCCSMGGTPRTIFPILLGYGIMGHLNLAGVTAHAINAQGMLVGMCFAAGLAPITGVFGIRAGILAGMLHYCLVTGVPYIHGGFNLYNGGFTAGIVCFVLVPILEQYAKKKRG